MARPDVEAVAKAIEAEQGLITDMAVHVGDQVHDILKRHAMTMPTAGAAMAVGLHVAGQMFCESVQFGENSMEGDAEDAATVRAAGFLLFVDLVDGIYPGALAKAVNRVDQDSAPS